VIRNRLILELMARGGMRIGEVLKLTSKDISDQKLILRDPKSGRENEIVFIPKRVAERLKGYARSACKDFRIEIPERQRWGGSASSPKRLASLPNIYLSERYQVSVIWLISDKLVSKILE
jgi:integrase